MAFVSEQVKTSFAPKLCKTRMCKFFEEGNCSKGDKCSFAHSLSDLQSRPNLHKTQLCMAFERNGTCRDGPACKYAHGESELQSNAKRASVTVTSSNVQAVPLPVALQVVMLNNAPGCNTIRSQSNPAAVFLQPVHMIGVLTHCSSLINVSSSEGETAMKKVKEADICSVITTDEDLDFELESSGSSSRQTSEWSSISEADSNEQAASESDSSSQCQFTSDARSESPEDPPVLVKQEEGADVIVSKALEMCLQRTKMCKFFLRGECTKGSRCKFAHDSRGLKTRPNLFRTSLCMAFERSGHCKLGDACKYAHGIDQLQKLPVNSDCVKATVAKSYSDHMFTTSHEASGIIVSAKNTFITLRQKAPETRRRSSSC